MGGWWAGSSPQPQPPSLLPPPTPAADSSLLIGRVCSDVVGIADKNPQRPARGRCCPSLGLCYVVASSPGCGRVLAAAAWSRVPAAAAAASAMVSPVTVVSV